MGAVSWLLAAGMAALISLAGVASGVWPHSAAASGGVTAPAKARSVSTDVLGARVQDPPAAWPVRGCEVMTVQPGSTVASLGLVGASQRIDPMGDVIAAVQDVTVGGGTQATPDCAALAAAAARAHDGDTITVTYDHRIAGLLGGRWVVETACGTVSRGAALACPSPLAGTITSSRSGNRIQIPIEIRGPQGSAAYSAVVDTGADETIVPDGVLRSLGFSPAGTTITAGLIAGTQSMSFVYRLPSSALLVRDQGSLVPLTTGTVLVWGMPQESGVWLGPNILELGVTLTTSGRQWTLTPPCAP